MPLSHLRTPAIAWIAPALCSLLLLTGCSGGSGSGSRSPPSPSPSPLPPGATGSAELTWTAPTQNEDGSALTNLAGYKIRYGTSPAALTQTLVISSPRTTSAVIEGLSGGTWYFTVASYTNTGIESAQTGAVSKTIR